MKRIGEPVLACEAPHELSPAQIEPWMFMFLSAGMLMVVPALMINFAPPATNKSPSMFMTPVQVSVPVIVPEEVSFTAIAEGAVDTMVTNKETRNKLTKPILLLFWTFTDIIHPRHVVQILD